MPTLNTTLTVYEKKEGNGARGPWTLHIYKDTAGQSFQTFEAPISNRVYGFLNKPAVIDYEQKARPGSEYTNNVIKGISPDETAQAVSAASVASQMPPEVAELAGPLPTLTPTPTGGADDRQIQIMRQSALERAIRFHAAFASGPIIFDDVIHLSDRFLDYFINGDPLAREKDVIAALEELAA